MSKLPKWDEARTEALASFVGNESPVSRATIEDAATELETSVRSISSKLIKMGYETEKVSATKSKTFTDEQEEFLRTFLEQNAGEYTFAEIADVFAEGSFTAQQLQGKILSMELTDLVKPAEKKVYKRVYNEEAEATFVDMANAGEQLEAIAETLGVTVQSARGKALSLLRSGHIDAIPASNKVAKKEDAFQGLEVSEMTVEEIADKIDRSPRGVKTMLTRRGLVAADYDGAARAAKAAAAREAACS
jgi:hypothetical protein